MKQHDVGKFIQFGTAIRYLIDVKEGFSFRGKGCVERNLRGAIRSCELYGLQVSHNWANSKLRVWMGEVEARIAEADSAPPQNRLTRREAEQLSDLVEAWRSVIFAEAPTVYNFLVSSKRYSLDHLINDPVHLLRATVFDLLPVIARSDFSEGCMCVALERNTAAAFHLMRCIEATLRDLYAAYFVQNRTEKNWGPITLALRKKPKKPRPSTELLDQLDVLRRNFRNPTQHPEKEYDSHEAQNLLGTSIDVLERIVHDPKYQTKYGERVITP